MYGDLLDLVSRGEVAVLSGAGLSTESGIPDYRGPTGATRAASPMTYQEFTGSPQARQRYWARSHLGWRSIAGAAPNPGHRAVADLQAGGLVAGIVTQNVDGLHQAAGAQDVLELHGALGRVVCLACGDGSSRESLSGRLNEANPGFRRGQVPLRPDGDVDLNDVDDFHVVDCLGCGGLLKPDVVFFGESVPLPRVERALDLVEQARSLLVLGSSLTVMSGYRFVLHATRHDVPVAIVNQGPTRGDPQSTVRVDAPLGKALSRLVADLRDTDSCKMVP